MNALFLRVFQCEQKHVHVWKILSQIIIQRTSIMLYLNLLTILVLRSIEGLKPGTNNKMKAQTKSENLY